MVHTSLSLINRRIHQVYRQRQKVSMTVHSSQSFQIMAFVTATFWSSLPLTCKQSRTTAITVYYPLLPSLCVSVPYLQHWLDHAFAQHMTAIANTIALLHCSGQCLKTVEGWVPSAQARCGYLPHKPCCSL